MTIQVMVANTSVGGRTALVTIVDKNGNVSPEHHHLEGGECRLLTIWEGKHLVISEETPTYLNYPPDASNG